MQEPLDRFIKQNRDAFDTQAPSPELWERIGERSPEIQKARRKEYFLVVRRIAAAVILLMGVAAIVQLFFSKSPVDDVFFAAYSPLDEEIREAVLYYEVEIEHKRQLVYELTSGEPAINEGLEIDLAQLDEVLHQLKSDLKDNVANKEVLAAMIQNYRLKLGILEQILNYVETNEPNHETSHVEGFGT